MPVLNKRQKIVEELRHENSKRSRDILNEIETSDSEIVLLKLQNEKMRNDVAAIKDHAQMGVELFAMGKKLDAKRRLQLILKIILS